MTDQIRYRKMTTGEEKEVHELIVRVFQETIAPLFCMEGISTFMEFIQPEKLRKQVMEATLMLLAETENQLVGMIAVRQNQHISLLFVDHAFRRRGIARELLKRSLLMCRERKPDLENISVNASPNSVVIYERLGFIAQENEQLKDGIRFTPMVLIVKNLLLEE